MARDLRLRDPESRRARTTLAVYLGSLGLILLAVLWAARAVMFQPWTARAWVTGAVVGNQLYLLGGRSATGALYREIYGIDLATRRLHRSGELPTARFGAAAATVGRWILVMGGLEGRKLLDEIVEVDTATGRTRELGRLPTGLAFAGAAVIGDVVYVVGGWDGTHTTDQILTVDPSSGAASVAGRLPMPVEQAAVAAAGGLLYTVGGMGDSASALDRVYEIDPASPGGPRLVRTARLPAPRSRGAVVTRPDGLLVLGGWAGRELEETYLVDTRGATLTVTPAAKLPRGMSDFLAVERGGRTYLVGGRDERLARQIGVTVWDPGTGVASRVQLRGFLGL